MKALGRKNRQDCAAEAREWLVRLRSPDLRPEEITAWETWIRFDPARQEAFDRATGAWNAAKDAMVDRPDPWELAADAYDGSMSVARWKQSRRSRPRLVWSSLAAAGLILVAGGVGYARWDEAARTSQTVVTSRGEDRRAALPDGSEIRAAAMTRIKVDFDRRNRRIDLSQGEAEFAVAHDRSRPFVVHTSRGLVRAVGTVFDVHVGSDAVSVSVTEGVVEVRPRTGRDDGVAFAPIRVPAGHMLVSDAHGVRIRALPPGAARGASWLEGRLEYVDQPLERVIEDINRYAARPIVLEDAAAGRLNYTGTVRLDAIEAWLRGLDPAFNLRVQVESVRFRLETRSGASRRASL